MSNHYYRNNQIQQDSHRNNTTQKKFVPKSQNQYPNPTLSSSLRQSLSKESNVTPEPISSSVSGESSRLPTRDNGDWISTASGGVFVNYLPQDEAVAAGLAADKGGLDPLESQTAVLLLNRELSRLLKLKPKDFWREVATDTSLHEFLDSFLQFRSRWYDFPYRGTKDMVAGVIVGESDLSRRVFMTLYRISSNRDTGAPAAESLSMKDYTVYLQERKLLDLPKLLDICAIYSHENEDLTRLLVCNALKAQPEIHENMSSLMSHFLGMIKTMDERCRSSLETLFSTGNYKENGSSRLLADLLEVMDFINDAVVSMDAFVTLYKPAAVIFACPVEASYGNEELLTTLAKLHDYLLPSLQRGLRAIIVERDDERISNIAMSLKMLSARVVKFGCKVLEICYLNDEELEEDAFAYLAVSKMFPAKVEDPIIRADILVQTFREINGASLGVMDNQKSDTFLQNVEKHCHAMRTLERLQNTGWISMDDEQFQYLSGIMISSSRGAYMESTHAQAHKTNNRVHIDEDAAVTESRIHQIKDLFPDYGIGFLAMCLEVYDHNSEEVIQRILEGTLHEDLQKLDTSLQTLLLPKSAPVMSRNDKGKEKLVESVAVEKDNITHSISPTLTTGRYVRKSRNNDLPDQKNMLDIRNEKETARTTALVSQYEYEDEYDDSFDDLGLSTVECELDEDKVLGDSASSTQTDPNAKWGSRKKPQFYVKDGKNYSYKVTGSVAVANVNEASLVTQAQVELIHGLGRGGNFPRGAVNQLMAREEQFNHSDVSDLERKGGDAVKLRGIGRGVKSGGRRPSETNEKQDNQLNDVEVEGEGRGGDVGSQRGRGRRGGGRHNNFRKDRALKKHVWFIWFLVAQRTSYIINSECIVWYSHTSHNLDEIYRLDSSHRGCLDAC